jgi:hypothetical protein
METTDYAAIADLLQSHKDMVDSANALNVATLDFFAALENVNFVSDMPEVESTVKDTAIKAKTATQALSAILQCVFDGYAIDHLTSELNALD